MQFSIHQFTQRQILVFSLGLTGAILVLFGLASLAMFRYEYRDRFYPGVTVNGINLAGKTQTDVQNIFAGKKDLESANVYTITFSDKKLASTAAQLNIHSNYDQALAQAYSVGRQSDFFNSLLNYFMLSKKTTDITAPVEVDETVVTDFINTFKGSVDQSGKEPEATLKISGRADSLQIFGGKTGSEIDVENTRTAFIDQVKKHVDTVAAVATTQSFELTAPEIDAAKKRAQLLVGKSIRVNIPDQRPQTLNDQQLISLLQFPNGYSDKKLAQLTATWKKTIVHGPQNAVLDYDTQTLVVKTFTPPRKGLAFDDEQAKTKIEESLVLLETPTGDSANNKTASIDLPVKETDPEITLDKTNNLGIVERIGFGESEYHHSIPGRIHNVALTASRINNTIVKPGDEFSFNKTLGDVSAATGYAPAYVIQNGKTVLGDGGGVCQVSSTLFRALLNAGLPITKRHPHSYRVSYYELNSQPGFDATVYSGDIDLRFINDTGHDILIHTETDSENLYMKVELYGTSDGRTTQIADYHTWGYQPAPPARYQDDPTLPHGRIQQVDFAASGINVEFKNIVKDKNGNVIRTDDYVSNYQPWQAVFLRGV